jgi:hypothetical protein
MLSDDDKRRIAAEEAYRAEVRGAQQPVKTEGFTDKLNRVRMWSSVAIGVICLLVLVATCSR